jgi:hypothetical protein
MIAPGLEFPMRWVETRRYAGPDRRATKCFRLFDRRKVDRATALPAIQVMLRQLHLRVLDVETAREAVAQYQLRLSVARAALRDSGQIQAAEQLAQIERTLRTSRQKGVLTPQDLDAVQDYAAAALCALR